MNTSSYTDPENIEDIFEKIKEAKTIKDVKELIDRTFPTWIVNFTNSYSSDYACLQNNWQNYCEILKTTPKLII